MEKEVESANIQAHPSNDVASCAFFDMRDKCFEPFKVYRERTWGRNSISWGFTVYK